MIAGSVRPHVDWTLSVTCVKQSSHGRGNSWRYSANANVKTSGRFCCDALDSLNVKSSVRSCCDPRELSNVMPIDYVCLDLLECARAWTCGTCEPSVTGCSDCVLPSYGPKLTARANGVTLNRHYRGGDCCEKPQGWSQRSFP